MNIYPISYTPQTQKTTFTGYHSKFTKKLDSVLLSSGEISQKEHNSLMRMFCEFLQKKLNPKRILGEGHHGEVYRIDDKYVLKKGIFEPNFLADFKLVRNPKFKDLKTYYGEPVAYFSNFKILRNVSSNSKHTPVGIPINMSRSYLPDEQLLYYENSLLPKTAKLPQKAFDAIAKDLDTLNKIGNYTFDYNNPNNFVIVGKTLRITDEISPTNYSNSNTAADLLRVFIKDVSICTDAQYSFFAEANRRVLLKKITKAAMKANLNLASSGENFKTWDIVLNDLCRVNIDPYEFIRGLKYISAHSNNVKERLALTDKYLAEIMG